jgi:hypothetical protein
LIPVLVFVSRDILSIYRNDLKPPFNFRGIFDKIWENRYYWLTLIIMAVIPVLIGSIWTRHTDLIKENSIFTKWLASKALEFWHFGSSTWSKYLDQLSVRSTKVFITLRLSYLWYFRFLHCHRYGCCPWRNNRDTSLHNICNCKRRSCFTNIFKPLSASILLHLFICFNGNNWWVWTDKVLAIKRKK